MKNNPVDDIRLGFSCYDPRKTMPVPFIPYPYQERMIRELVIDISVGNILDRRYIHSPHIGVTWTMVAVIDWFCRVVPASFLCVSRTLNYAEMLQEKFIYLQEHYAGDPGKGYENKDCLCMNRDTGSRVKFASVGQRGLGKGNRYTAVFFDSVDAWDKGILKDAMRMTRDCAKVRIAENRGAFNFDGLFDGWETRKIFWWECPEYTEGLYFDMESKRWRSKWYDRQIEIRMMPEVDMCIDMEKEEE